MNKTNAFLDGTGELFIGANDDEIVSLMSRIEWGEITPPNVWKARVQERCHYLGVEIIFDSATTFLNSLEYNGLGKRCSPAYVARELRDKNQIVKITKKFQE